ncbi:MAG: DUF4407 domain-containing protein [Mycobacteriaceae bacterium]|nr:DUF4407 domain-containing protein [Mycobacteriaceae bacterium]
MCAQQMSEPQSELPEGAIRTVVVSVGAVLAWIVVSLAVGESASWPMAAVVAVALGAGLLVGMVTRSAASGAIHGWPRVVGRGMVTAAVGVLIGELATLIALSGSIEHRLDERAVKNAASIPAVAQALDALDHARSARIAQDESVDRARQHRDDALVVARCEYHPLPECPQTHITGVPGVGPETRTANALLTATQQELDTAIATRESAKAKADAEIAQDEQTLAAARQAAMMNSDHGLGARWIAMNDLTLTDPSATWGALTLRLTLISFFVLLYLLPLILRLWHSETTRDRRALAQAKRERAELEAETAIAIKRAEIRQATEIIWAEQQLAGARLAAAAQTVIDRAYHHRHIAEALQATAGLTDPTQAVPEVTVEPADDDMYLPIAAQAEAASRAALPAPERVSSADTLEPRGEHPAAPSRQIPEVVDLTADTLKAAARWIRPLVPPILTRALGSTVQPLRAARQAIEEVEEITFMLRRTHKVTMNSESQPEPQPFTTTVRDEQADRARIPSARVLSDQPDPFSTDPTALAELRSPHEPRQLPPGK